MDGRPSAYLDLYDYRVQVSAMDRERHRSLAAGEDPEQVVTGFRAKRDRLFATHQQSALDAGQRRAFQGLVYFEYDPRARVEATVTSDVESRQIDMGTSGPDALPMHVVAYLDFRYRDRAARLSLFWIDVYGGGLFLPFRDTTAPDVTYGAGRYLFDTVKGSTFERLDGLDGEQRIVLDFNYAYNPSCAYNPRWACPLAPPENRLPFAVPAGEKKFEDRSQVAP